MDKHSTALIVIDLQKGIALRTNMPHSSQKVILNSSKLADEFRRNNMPVFLVRVTPSPDAKDRLSPLLDEPPTPTTPKPDWADIVGELGPRPGDFVITKRQWGAFYGTELDLQMRRRGIKTIVLTGISTNFGVESTARIAYELGH